MSEVIKKSCLYDAIVNREDEYRSALLREKNYNTATALQLQGLLNATTLIKHLVFDFPTIDAVPVVRCKDCKYYNPPFEVDGTIFEGDCDFHEWYRCAPTENDFCSVGVRKDV